MIAFTLYIAIVWYYAACWRRTLRSFVFVALAFLGLVALALLHIKLRDWTDGAVYLPVLQGLLYPYALLVLVSGLAVASLPPRHDVRRCRICGYDLSGMGADQARCPECAQVDPALAPPARAAIGTKTLFTYQFGGSRPSQA